MKPVASMTARAQRACSPAPFCLPRAAGFTLIEVLMVVLLVGIIAGIVVMSASPGSPERAVVHELDRLTAVMSLAQDEAQADNLELGLKVVQGGYAFMVFDEQLQKWGPYLADDSFKPRELPDHLSIRILRESQVRLPRHPAGPPVDQEAAKKWEPDILFLSSGEVTPVTLEISAPDAPGAEQTLELDELGGMKRSDRSEDADHAR